MKSTPITSSRSIHATLFNISSTMLLLLGLYSEASSQTHFCGQTEVMNNWFAKHPSVKINFEELQLALKKTEELQPPSASMKTTAVTDTIPMVFHILHTGGSENISNAQIADQVSILNRDFQKRNADTSSIVAPFMNNIANVGFAFKLATLDPQGNCTNGIIRHYTTKTDWDANDLGQFIYSWPREKYLNIYIVRSMNIQATAYTFLPGIGIPPEADVIVCMYNMCGSIGTGTVANSRVLTHEVGHWFGLQHIWGVSNQPGVACGDDLVNDTPITKGFVSCSINQSDVCTPGIFENVQNYMDYSPCKIMFTNGQASRMQNTKNSTVNNRNLLTKHSNLVATGVVNPIVCAPEAEFQIVDNKRNICAGNTIQFKDSTGNTQVTAWSWSFPGGVPASSTDSMPLVLYANPGLYSVTYTATNSAGTSAITKTDWIRVISNTASVQDPYTEGFETITFPNADWTVDNTSGGPAWTHTNTSAASGSHCIMLDNSTNSLAVSDAFYTPSYNINSIMTANPGATFTFKLAHQRSSGTSNEKLRIFSSTNCGQTWMPRYTKTGAALATVSAISTNPYIPSALAEWRTESFPLIALGSYTNVLFKFVFTSDSNGDDNNIYIDNINISNSDVRIDELSNKFDFEVYPNPASGSLSINTGIKDGFLEVCDVLGNSIYSQQLTAPVFTLNVAQFSKGMYTFKITCSYGLSVQKVIID